MKSKLKLNSVFLLFALFLLFVTVFGGRGNSSAFAATDKGETVYSSVLDDLEKDENFKIEKYPYIENDYSLQVIQVAESADKELFIYVYQPCGTTLLLPATKVNMSLTESVDGTELYDLTLLNSNGVFQKLKVDGLAVSDDEVRYYNITSIFRKYNSDFDTGSTSESIITGMAFEIGQIYTATTESDKINYSRREVDVVKVTDIFFDFLRYPVAPSGIFVITQNYTDSHIVAFSTDWEIDKLIDADISFICQERKGVCVGHTTINDSGKMVYANGKSYDKFVTLSSVDEVTVTSSPFWGGKTYSWNRIEKASDFIKNSANNLTSSAKNSVKNKQWVFRFYETSYKEFFSANVSSHEIEDTFVSDIAILRLFFEKNEDFYNLGAVSDIGHGDNIQGNEDEKFDFFDWLESVTGIPAWVWKLIFIIVPVIILLPILSVIFPVVGQALLLLLKGLWWIITLPFKGIKALINLIKDKKSGG